MSDLRYDPVFDSWTVVAENRRERPLEFVPHEQVRKSLICPFCAGNEEETPPPLALYDPAGDPLDDLRSARWSARVFQNRYPTFSSPQDPEQATGPAASLTASETTPECGPYLRRSGPGAQELVIPTPRHVVSLAQLDPRELVVGWLAAQQRIRQLADSPGLAHAMFFCNCRFEAGASIEHVHFQLIGSPLPSPRQQERVQRFADWRKQHGQSLLQSLVQFEESDGKRMIASGKAWSVFCPLASRMPFQVWMVPRQERRSFTDCPREELDELARLTLLHVRRLEELLGEPGYNWLVHQPPFRHDPSGDWFIEVVPRLAKSAGYELGTDIWVNPVSPETAARRLR